MAGTIPYSLSQQFDEEGNVLAGGKLYLIQAGTVSTPQNGYQDSALTLALANPIILDAAGRVPQIFLADGTIKVRLTSAAGVQQVSTDGIMVVGASSGSGTGTVVDATTLLATGDLKVRYGTGVLAGFVRCNGRTIGSATSSASERANADCVALFEYLYDADTNLAVSTGRGASAAADWAANKNIALPDWRGRALAALDDMGTTAAGRLTSTYFGTSPIVLGAASTPTESKTLATANLPPYTPAGSVATTINGQFPQSGAGGGNIPTTGSADGFVTPTATSIFTGTAQGGVSTPFAIVQPTMLATVYLKL